MPEMDGFEATARTRIPEAGRGPIPIMAMIADAVEAALEQRVDEGTCQCR